MLIQEKRRRYGQTLSKLHHGFTISSLAKLALDQVSLVRQWWEKEGAATEGSLSSLRLCEKTKIDKSTVWLLLTCTLVIAAIRSDYGTLRRLDSYWTCLAHCSIRRDVVWLPPHPLYRLKDETETSQDKMDNNDTRQTGLGREASYIRQLLDLQNIPEWLRLLCIRQRSVPNRAAYVHLPWYDSVQLPLSTSSAGFWFWSIIHDFCDVPLHYGCAVRCSTHSFRRLL